ncbi:hypothetical protein WILDE_49 [Arthrobacter phage Wilde]|uniref:Uncharacterized protein n=1 Tax=Arthrobacter phage Wilde TaxID=1772323 RepID=A0A0U4JR46_9CAUD|nr:hypothetical protein WILDE_49 [Arthrobacter phage Wilde]
MSEFKQGNIVRCYPGTRQGRSYIAVVISEGVVEFGGTDCVRVQQYDAGRRGGTDYLAVTHVDVLGRVEGSTGYVQTFADALSASDIPLDDIVIEDRAQSLKAQKIIKGFRGVKL